MSDNIEKLKEFSETTMKWGERNIAILKGLSALLFGVLLIYLSHRLIINLIVFSCGLLLIYYGMQELKLRTITNFIDKALSKLKR